MVGVEAVGDHNAARFAAVGDVVGHDAAKHAAGDHVAVVQATAVRDAAADVVGHVASKRSAEDHAAVVQTTAVHVAAQRVFGVLDVDIVSEPADHTVVD